MASRVRRFGRARAGPVFQSGLFRSGTTMAWNILRRDGGFHCYCEPCHEHLLELVGSRQGAVDPTHTGVEDYWSEYHALDRADLAAHYPPWIGRRRFELGPEDEAPDLAAYLEFLVAGAPRRPVLKFTRAGLRLGWLRATFPEATIVHVTRAARDVWTSAVGRRSERDGRGGRGTFPAYYELIARDVGIEVRGHPYREFYALWLAYERAAAGVADETWVYEEIVADYPAWARRHLVDTGLCDSVPQVPVRGDSLGAQFHEPGWYDDQESAVEAVQPWLKPEPLRMAPAAG